MNEKFHKKVALESALFRAIERHEFLVHYQPLLDIRSNGSSAWKRWCIVAVAGIWLGAAYRVYPGGGGDGMILAIGEFVLRTACYDAKSWQDRGFPPLKVAVNISPIQFKKTDLVQVVTSVLHEPALSRNIWNWRSRRRWRCMM